MFGNNVFIHVEENERKKKTKIDGSVFSFLCVAAIQQWKMEQVEMTMFLIMRNGWWCLWRLKIMLFKTMWIDYSKIYTPHLSNGQNLLSYDEKQPSFFILNPTGGLS